jgi:hypothetical protein
MTKIMSTIFILCRFLHLKVFKILSIVLKCQKNTGFCEERIIILQELIFKVKDEQ